MSRIEVVKEEGEVFYRITSWATLFVLQEGDTLVSEGETMTVKGVDPQSEQVVQVESGEEFPYRALLNDVGLLLPESDVLDRMVEGLKQDSELLESYTQLMSKIPREGQSTKCEDFHIQLAVDDWRWTDINVEVYQQGKSYLWTADVVQGDYPGVEVFQSKEELRQELRDMVEWARKRLQELGREDIGSDDLKLETEDELELVDGELEESLVTYSL